MNKICLIHFQAIEKYPPVINFLRFLGKNKIVNVIVYTTNYHYKLVDLPSNIQVIRIGKINKNSKPLLRYFEYFKFYLFVTISLAIKKIDKILYYETLSSLPVLLIKKIKKVEIFVHYHEYLSPSDYEKGMVLNKLFHKIEKKNYNSFCWISQTNRSRLNLFIKDNPEIINTQLFNIVNNYPPRSWSNNITEIKKLNQPIKFVYLGALSLETMYTIEFASWIESLNGNAIWDIYSNNFTSTSYDYIVKLNSPFINFKKEIKYDIIPDVLKKYDIGLVFYKGYDDNNIYSEANKIFEYYVNGVDTWISDKLIGSKHLCNNNIYPKISFVNFEKINEINFDTFTSRENLKFNKKTFIMEEEFDKLVKKILQ